MTARLCAGRDGRGPPGVVPWAPPQGGNPTSRRRPPATPPPTPPRRGAAKCGEDLDTQKHQDDWMVLMASVNCPVAT